jgi:hypothetical protein
MKQEIISKCPVCGYDKLKGLPEDFNICPCCGTEFGYDDHTVSHAELRQRWIDEGRQWWSSYTKPPADWNPEKQ